MNWSQTWTCLALLGVAISLEAEPLRPAGHLVIIGGGRQPLVVMKRFVDLAGGSGRARIVVIPMASENPGAAAESQIREFTSLGITNAVPLLLAHDSASQTGALTRLNDATGVFFTGGDQSRLASFVVGTPIQSKLRELYYRGAVVGGTSAGAAIMSEVMITGEQRTNNDAAEKFTRVRSNDVVTATGLGLVTNAIIDQHFLARKRLNRLLSIVLEHPHLLGIGIDEDTAIVVLPNGSFEVVGERSVLVLDARRSVARKADPRGNLGARSLKTHLLLDGDRFDPGADSP